MPDIHNISELVIAPDCTSHAGRVVACDFSGQPLSGDEVALAELTPDERHLVVDNFHDIIARLSSVNGNKTAWWYTWLSCHDRMNVKLLDYLSQLQRIEKLLSNHKHGKLHFSTKSSWLATAVEKKATSLGWKASRQGPFCSERPSWLRRMRDALTEPLRWKWAAWRAAQKLENPAEVDVIIVTMLDKGHIGRGVDPFVDTYFGTMAADLIAQGKNVLTVGFTYNEHSAVSKLITKASVPVTTLGQFLSIFDVFRAFIRGLLFRIDMGQLNLIEAGLVNDSVGNIVREITIASSIQFAMERLLQRCPKAQVIHMYENNFWERGVDVAAKAVKPQRQISGYLHCAVLPAHTKNYISPSEIQTRPQPDNIFCTGKAARDVFIATSGFPHNRVHAGCALRGPALDGLVLKSSQPAKVERVLILLEGLESMVHFVRFVDYLAQNMNGTVEWLVRCHPVLPATEMSRISGVDISDDSRLKPSRHQELTDDLADADMVFYQGTTAALSAGYMGIPLLRFDGATLLSDDPLNACDALKKNVRTIDDVRLAMDTFLEMDDKTYKRECEQIRTYIADYLAPPSQEAIDAMVGNVKF